MDVQISRESGVPLRLQVCRQIALLIAVGKLKPGEYLPSIRALASRLKIHYNTVSQAYQDLAAYHMVERHRGSRMMVPFPSKRSGTRAGMDLDDVINDAIQLAQDHGYSLQQLRQRVHERLLVQPPDHLLVVASESGMRELICVELAEQVACPVEACSVKDLSANRALAFGALVVAAPGDMPDCAALLHQDRPPYPITINRAEQHRTLVQKLKEPSVIAVVSVSQIFLQTAQGLLAPALGSRHTLREYFLPTEKPGSLDAFRIVFCDSITRQSVKARNLIHCRVISPESLAYLAGAIIP
ncbi:MAG TPA: GntR family transcriptional regulator [Terriglobia bacterium]|nr:GntR family transcriptional regulator [Terriglobia bacterium]